MTVLAASLWSFVILPVAPAYAAFLSTPPAAEPSWTSQAGSSTSGSDDETARTLAGYAQSAGSMLNSGNGHTDMSTVAGDQLRNAATGAASAEVERWLSGFGTARVRLGVDRNFTLKNSEFDFLLPWYNVPEWVVFSQQSIHRTDDRIQMNLGAGVRHFGPEWMTGANAFYDYDLTRYHQRAGLGAELWRDYLKLGANGYFRLSGWRDAPELNNDYEARPANGWDVRGEGWLPAYPQVGGKLTYEQYYGKEVALFGTGNRQENPQALTAGLNWTPVPLVTLSAEHSMGNGGMNDSRFGLQLTWTPGMSLTQQLDPDAVRERRTLAGSRLDLVERNNNIVLEYRKKELIKLGLRERAEGTQGQAFTLVTSLQSKYPLQAIDWSAGDFLAAGGQMNGSGTATQFILPAYRFGSTAAETVQLNRYTVTAVARDSQGNTSSQAQSVLVVQDTGVQILAGNLTASSGARANGTDTNSVTAIVTDAAGRPVPGEVVTFMLPAGVTAAGTIVRSSRIQVTTNGIGVAALDLVSLTPGTYPLQASVGSSPAVSAATTFYENNGGGPEGILNLEMTVPVDDAPADGQATNTVQVVVKDRSGALQANQDVHFSVTPGAVLSATDVKTDGNGIAQVTLTSTAAASYTVTASAGGGSRTVPVTFTAVVLQGTLAASPDAYTVGAHINSALTLTLTDQSGRPQPGRVVTFRGNSVVLDFSSVTDHGNGTYTAQVTTVPAIASPASLVITAMVDGQPLPGVQATLTVTGAPQPVFTLTANTQVNPYAFAANSGFPTTGFVGATFTVTGLPAGTTASDYDWTVQAQGGGSASWLTVDPAGMVTFNSQPSSAEKAVEVIATPKAGGQPVGYRFTLGAWFINNGTTQMNWTYAGNWCSAQPGDYSLATRMQMTNVLSGSGTRGTTGALWSEWGNLNQYSGLGFVSNGYWSLEQQSSGNYYVIGLYNGAVVTYSGGLSRYVVCLQKL
jgi:adhesin/invasin